MMVSLLPNRSTFIILGDISIQWYAILYLVAFGAGVWLARSVQQYRDLYLSWAQWLEVATWTMGGVLIGGRLGYVLLYEPLYYWQQPADIFALWQGGMSSHGGFVGVAVATWLAARSLRVDSWRLFDVLVVPAALGLLLGRVGNIINGELYVTLSAQAFVVTQYVVIVGTSWWLLWRSQQPGVVTGVFLVLYGVLRFLNEFLRADEWPLVFGLLTRGQVYTLPLLAVGIWILWKCKVKSAK